jgi:hypothetical protein
MRANSSIASLAVVLILASGCRPAEDQAVVVAPPELPPPDPAPVPGPTQVVVDDLREVVTVTERQGGINVIRERPVQQERSGSSIAAAPSPTVTRLFFQCTDGVTFSVRGVGQRLQVFPPGYSGGYIVLTQQPSDADLYATSRDGEFRMKDDLATLEVGRDRYVDCVSNPAAAVWQVPSPRDIR